MYILCGDYADKNTSFIGTILSDVHKFDLKTREWSQVDVPAMPALTELSCVLYNGEVYIFGGISSTKARTNNLYKLTLSTMQLQQIYANASLLNRTYPPDGSCHNSLLHNDIMYVFGGWNPQTENSADPKRNEFYGFDMKSQTWAQIPQYGDIPSRRRAHKTVLYKDEMYVFGGYSTHTENDLFKFNFSNYTWTKLQPTGNIPCSRSRFAMARWENKAYLLGGFHMDGTPAKQMYLNDFYELNLDSLVWTKINGSFPRLAGQHSMEVVNGCLFIFGGNDGVVTLNDFYGSYVSDMRLPILDNRTQ